MKKVFIYVHACEQRSLDARKVSDYFSKNNYEIVKKPKNADIIIYFTCAVLKNKTKKALNMIKEFQNRFNAELIVAGCLPDIEKKELSRIFKGKTLSTKDLYKIDEFFPDNRVKFDSIEDANVLFDEILFDRMLIDKIISHVPEKNKIYNKIKPLFTSKLFEDSLLESYILRISWGCNSNCSYCGIKKAIGSFYSKPIEECIKEIKKGLKAGYSEFVIVADSVGAYGRDIKKTFPELLEKVTAIKADHKISIQSLDPFWLVKYIDEIKAIKNKEKIKSIQICLQSGSNRILKLMNRYSNIDKIRDALLDFKSCFPKTLLSVEFMISFPTETAEELNKTLSLVKDIGFNSGQFFTYSERPGTDALKIKPKITKLRKLYNLYHTKKELKKQGYNLYPGYNIFEK
jgi:MiaB/RimO family radical SAM methylthiotransferase